MSTMKPPRPCPYGGPMPGGSPVRIRVELAVDLDPSAVKALWGEGTGIRPETAKRAQRAVIEALSAVMADTEFNRERGMVA